MPLIKSAGAHTYSASVRVVVVICAWMWHSGHVGSSVPHAQVYKKCALAPSTVTKAELEK